MTTPHLKTALSGELAALEKTLINATAQIERWFRLQWQEHTPPFYGSVDVRNAGYKIAPVDTNLFPGGFNNLSPDMLPLAIIAAQASVDKYCPDARNLLLIPENHTRNTFYLENVFRLTQILRQTGLVVRLGSLNPEITSPTELTTASGNTICLEPLIRIKHGNGERLGLDHFDPCMVLLNNDLTAGAPDILRNLDSQIVLPPLHGGWATRRKTHHFSAYDTVAKSFAAELNIDDWLINPYFAKADGLDFSDGTGVPALQDVVSDVLAKIRVKYAEYGIDETPFLIVKADAGTYGMGIMQVKSPDDLASLNRKQRNKMSVIKEGATVHEVIVQEGVPTIEQVNGGAAEPVVYMMDRFVVGGFYRVNTQRGRDENLNAPGMSFEPLAFEKPCNLADTQYQAGCPNNRFYTYGVVGRLALLAASLELELANSSI
jgi:glutamate--cysteine ligase